ncbi:MAG: mismatch repair endonuclease MutL [Pseudomonadota bacterium]|jgi:DNA mismatch repair protein MutL
MFNIDTQSTNNNKTDAALKIKINTQTIQLLSDRLINQIAAGEVIERPASVLKELLENALDAGSTTVIVRLEGGGINRLDVQDNGDGIPAHALPMAVLRHATSKITTQDELMSVSSFGFRGEALASISSVAQLAIISRTKTCQYATQYDNYLGNWQEQPASHGVGTTVCVRELFFSIPARRKFLKTESTELTHCVNVFESIALAQPTIQFELFHNGKILRRLSPTTGWQRIEHITKSIFNTNEDDTTSTHQIEVSHSGISVYGVLSTPQNTQNRAKLQALYVNGRPIRDRAMAHAIRSSYQGILHGDNQPNYCLFMRLPADSIDVNVHPTKSEIRFRDGSAVYRLLKLAVEQALGQIISSVSFDSKRVVATGNPVWQVLPEQHSKPQIGQATQTLTQPAYSNPKTTQYATQDLLKTNLWPTLNDTPSIDDVADGLSIIESKYTLPSNSSNSISSIGTIGRLGVAIAQIHGVYILTQTAEGMGIVDMHAAHERVLYEAYKTELAQGDVASQILLETICMTLTGLQCEAANTYQTTLLELGFDVSLLSVNVLAIRAVPSLLRLNDVTHTLTALLDELLLIQVSSEGLSHILKTAQHERLASLACQSAVRANRQLSIAEMNGLLRQMEQTANADRCNHGRPTWFGLTMQDLDRRFMRGK